MINRQRLLASFVSLAKVDGPPGREQDIASAVMQKLQTLGITSQQDEAGRSFGGNSGNVLAHLPGTVPGCPILLCSHMDTVQPTKGLEIVRRNGTIGTSGTSILGADDRAGIAAILEVLAVLHDYRIDHGPIDILFTVCEEAGMHGSKNVAQENLKARLGFVFDCSAPPGEFVISAPGAIAFRIEVEGRAAHAAVWPERGINAIQIAGRAIADLPLGRIDEVGMANIGLITGGKAINIVPDLVTVEGETRNTDNARLQQQMEYIEERFHNRASETGGKVRITRSEKYSGFSLSTDSPIVKNTSAAIIGAGFVPTPIQYPGGSDANIMNEKGIPTVNLGMGYQNVHTYQETISEENLVAAVSIGLAVVKHAAQMTHHQEELR
jgi:tripeptide aminopeptidase